MTKIEFEDLGAAEVKRITKKAALISFDDEDRDEQWVPFSVMSTPTAAECDDGNSIERFRVESWFADKME